MKQTARLLVVPAALLAVIAVACRDFPSDVDNAGTFTVNLQIGEESASTLDQLRITLLQSGQPVQNQSRAVSGSGSYQFNFDQLRPGTWQVLVRGLDAGEIQFFGEGTADVTVNQTSSMTVTLTSFVPSTAPLAATTLLDFSVSWPAIAGASGYDAVASRDPSFASSFPANQITESAGTVTADFTARRRGTTYFSVRANRADLPENGKAQRDRVVIVTDFVTVPAGIDATLSAAEPAQVYGYDAAVGDAIMVHASGTPNLEVTFGPPDGPRLGGDFDLGIIGDPALEWIVGITPPASVLPRAGASALSNPGFQTVDVSSPDGGTGDFSLTVQQCRVVASSVDANVVDAVSVSDCGALNPFNGFNLTTGVLVTFDGITNEDVTIDLTSTAFDATLFLFDPDGYLLDTSDDDGLDLNSRILATLPADGTYLAFVTPFGTTEAGAFSLDLRSGFPLPQLSYSAVDAAGWPEIRLINDDGTGERKLTNNTGIADFDASWLDGGDFLAFASDRTDAARLERDVFTMRADGAQITNLTPSAGDDIRPAWSPDGSRIVFVTDRDDPGGARELYIMNSDGTTPTNITKDPGDDTVPAWSPDGADVLFASDRDGDYEIYKMPSSGGVVTKLTDNNIFDAYPTSSPVDGSIAFVSNRFGDDDIFTMNSDGSAPTPLTSAVAIDDQPDWSPDGARLAFVSDRDGNREIYIMDADGSNKVRVTNTARDEFRPRWRPGALGLEPPLAAKAARSEAETWANLRRLAPFLRRR